ncbi:hypothetical protein BEL04_00905 [Mucilaginibacter sp. PPCGB 2223]|uniref:sensor histidine kinase n=1 Tax=Mucilaginibacter sp. PPCGB 2223 TaxID=1886027 RepID=UPI000824AF40|nr:HAMP domain-containing sensor histidine kinase [Mucilaginibacter sp. PPCGB 2223]OCX52918.1 hypothetical protein BEL04_00905 [Mucilaginibacter sp. PPCGB 2223]
MKKISSVLLLIVTLSCIATVIVNYYTIKVLSASRAYINGESQYSKGQKEASALLISYIYSADESEYRAFLKAISIPIGDRHAREALSATVTNDRVALAGFLQAGNHHDDIGNMIWLFKNFRHLGSFENAITIWEQGDAMVEELHQTGLAAHAQIASQNITHAQKDQLISKINTISAGLTVKQQAFSDTLGVISRKINFWAFLVNVIVTLFIIGNIILFVWTTFRRMQTAQNKIIEQNNNLQAVNAELDKVVYNLSHDLRSPLNSLTGLISLIDHEDNIDEIRVYTALMLESVNRQREFITEILQSVKNKQAGTNCDLGEVIEDVVAQNNYSNKGRKLSYYRDVLVNDINCDALKLKIVLNNLVSNAVKYSDIRKQESWIKIRAYRSETDCIIEVEDNGIGIRSDDKEHIFEKFFAAQQSRESTGIGLYLTKDAIQQMQGTINVNSEYGVGTKFIINIPCFTNNN